MNIKIKNQRALRARKRRQNLGRLRLLYFSRDGIFMFFPTACSPRDVILNLKLTIAPERLGVLHSFFIIFFPGENSLQPKKMDVKVIYVTGVPLP